MSRPLRRTVPALALLALAACTDAPLSPTEDGLEQPAPEFLIGSSPLIVLDPSKPAVEVTVEVPRGLGEVKIEDKVAVRFSAAFWWDGLAEPERLDAVDVNLLGVKDDGRGNAHPTGCIDIPAPLWDALVNNDESATGGNNPQLHVLSEVILTDGIGEEHVLDDLDVTITVDPKGDG